LCRGFINDDGDIGVDGSGPENRLLFRGDNELVESGDDGPSFGFAEK
jgi:hypothetical protein